MKWTRARSIVVAIVGILLVAVAFNDYRIYLFYVQRFQTKHVLWKGVEVSLPSSQYFVPPLDLSSSRLDVRDVDVDGRELILRVLPSSPGLPLPTLNEKCAVGGCKKSAEREVAVGGGRAKSISATGGDANGKWFRQYFWIEGRPFLIEFVGPESFPAEYEVTVKDILKHVNRLPIAEPKR
jgi:hypothetical protein